MVRTLRIDDQPEPDVRWSSGTPLRAALADNLDPALLAELLRIKGLPAEDAPIEAAPEPDLDDDALQDQFGALDPGDDGDLTHLFAPDDLTALFEAAEGDDWATVDSMMSAAQAKHRMRALQVKVEKSPKGAAGAEKLRIYWTTGPGGQKIRWGVPGDWARCVALTSKFLGDRAKGYCQLRHHDATGGYTGHAPGVETALTAARHAKAEAKKTLPAGDVRTLGAARGHRERRSAKTLESKSDDDPARAAHLADDLFDEHRHPRDRHGRFIRIGQEVEFSPTSTGSLSPDIWGQLPKAGGKYRVSDIRNGNVIVRDINGNEHSFNANDVKVEKHNAFENGHDVVRPEAPHRNYRTHTINVHKNTLDPELEKEQRRLIPLLDHGETLHVTKLPRKEGGGYKLTNRDEAERDKKKFWAIHDDGSITEHGRRYVKGTPLFADNLDDSKDEEPTLLPSADIIKAGDPGVNFPKKPTGAVRSVIEIPGGNGNFPSYDNRGNTPDEFGSPDSLDDTLNYAMNEALRRNQTIAVVREMGQSNYGITTNDGYNIRTLYTDYSHRNGRNEIDKETASEFSGREVWYVTPKSAASRVAVWDHAPESKTTVVRGPNPDAILIPTDDHPTSTVEHLAVQQGADTARQTNQKMLAYYDRKGKTWAYTKLTDSNPSNMRLGDSHYIMHPDGTIHHITAAKGGDTPALKTGTFSEDPTYAPLSDYGQTRTDVTAEVERNRSSLRGYGNNFAVTAEKLEAMRNEARSTKMPYLLSVDSDVPLPQFPSMAPGRTRILGRRYFMIDPDGKIYRYDRPVNPAIDFRHMNRVVDVDAMAKTIADEEKEFPDSILQKIDYGSARTLAVNGVGEAYGVAQMTRAHIDFSGAMNLDYFKSDTFSDKANEELGRPAWTFDTRYARKQAPADSFRVWVQGTILHEQGHHVAASMSVADRGKARQWLVDNGYLEVSENGKTTVKTRKLATDLSLYGTSNFEETLAESWAEYRLAGDDARPVAKAIGDIMRAGMTDDPSNAIRGKRGFGELRNGWDNQNPTQALRDEDAKEGKEMAVSAPPGDDPIWDMLDKEWGDPVDDPASQPLSDEAPFTPDEDVDEDGLTSQTTDESKARKVPGSVTVGMFPAKPTLTGGLAGAVQTDPAVGQRMRPGGFRARRARKR